MTKKKGFWANIMAKLDKKMENMAKNTSGCCCGPQESKKGKGNNSCCNG